MNPKDIAEVFKKGHLQDSEATIMFVRCAEAYRVDEIVTHIPEGLRQHFREFIIRCPDEDIPTIGLDISILKREWIQVFKSYYRNMGEPSLDDSDADSMGIQWRKAKKYVAEYRKGALSEWVLLWRLISTIPQETLEEIVPMLDEKHKERFIADLRVISKPGWRHFDGSSPSEEQASAIRVYLAKYDEPKV